MIIVTSSFPNISFFKMSSVHTDEEPVFSNSSGLKSVFEKLRFRDGLVWRVGLNRRNKAAFSYSSGVVWTRL